MNLFWRKVVPRSTLLQPVIFNDMLLFLVLCLQNWFSLNLCFLTVDQDTTSKAEKTSKCRGKNYRSALIHSCPRSLLGFIQYFEPLYYKAETNLLKNPEYKCIGKFHYIKYLAYLRSCTSIVCSSLMQSHWCVNLCIVIVTSMEENLSRPHFGEKSLNLSLYLIRDLLKTENCIY